MNSETIWKFELEITSGLQDVVIPKDAAILFVDNDPQGRLCVWVQVSPDGPTEKRYFEVYGSGQPLLRAGSFLGHVVQGPYVWHVFEVSLKSPV